MPARRTKLVVQNIGFIGDASRELGKEQFDRDHNRITPMVLVPMRLPCKHWVSIPEGFYAVVTSFGKYRGIWSPGYHVMAPWTKVSHLVTQQFVVFDSPVKECPTQDNVMVEIDVSIILNVMTQEADVKRFIYDLTPKGLQDMLEAFQEEAIRSMARQKNFSDIYDLMDTRDEAADDDDEDNVLEQLANAKRDVNERLNRYGINVYSITITNVHLPTAIREQMEKATTYDSKNREEVTKQEYSLLIIRNAEAMERAVQKKDDSLAEIRMENKKLLALEQKTLDEYQATSKKLILDINEESKATQLRIQTESDLLINRLQKKKELLLQTINAEAIAEAQEIQVTTEAWSEEKRVEAALLVQQNQSKMTRISADCEAEVAPKLASKREYDQKMAHLQVLMKLAKNKKIGDCV